jgi:hypothetical protein
VEVRVEVVRVGVVKAKEAVGLERVAGALAGPAAGVTVGAEAEVGREAGKAMVVEVQHIAPPSGCQLPKPARFLILLLRRL